MVPPLAGIGMVALVTADPPVPVALFTNIAVSTSPSGLVKRSTL